MKKWNFSISFLSFLCSAYAVAAPVAFPVKTITVKPNDHIHSLESIGTVESQRTTYIQTEIPGRVVLLDKNVGSLVTPGMVVAKMNPKITKDTYNEAQTQVNKLKMLIKAQQMLISRMKRLVAAGAFTGAQLEKQEVKLRVAKSDLKIAESQASKASFALRHTNVKSTVTGRVQEKKVTVGSVIAAGDPVYLVANTKNLHAVLPFPQAVRNSISVGNKVTLYSPTTTKPIISKVSFITPIINPVTRSFNVIVNFDNTSGKWHPGSSVKGFVQLTGDKQVYVVPSVSVVHRSQGEIVFVVRDGKPVEQKVVLGRYLDNGKVEVLSGLHAGERIVTYGAYFIHHGVGIKEA